VVLNSDSDSDSLPDLDDLLDSQLVAKTRAATRTAPVRNKEEPKAHGLPPPSKRSKDDKAFKRLVQAAQRHAQMEQEIAEAQAELDKPLREDSPERDPIISEKMVADAVNGEDDPDKAKKLYLAMQRTSAFQVDCVFHFFNQEPDHSQKPFPIERLEPFHMVSTFQGKILLPVRTHELIMSKMSFREFRLSFLALRNSYSAEDSRKSWWIG
jgi:hypothetical protein